MTYIEYARYAVDLLVLVDVFGKWAWLLKAADKRLVEEFKKLGVQMNQEKTKIATKVKSRLVLPRLTFSLCQRLKNFSIIVLTVALRASAIDH